jgi:hypothetical protein
MTRSGARVCGAAPGAGLRRFAVDSVAPCAPIPDARQSALPDWVSRAATDPPAWAGGRDFTVRLTARNADLEDLVGILRVEQARKIDLVTPARTMRLSDGALQVSGAEPIFD